MAVQASSGQLEQLIRDLNDPQHQAARDRIQIIQKQIQFLQRENSAWQTGLELLYHADPQMRFYGALTLTIKVNADWEKDKIGEDRSVFDSLLERLVTSYARLVTSGDAQFVLQKLCTTLVAIFQKPDAAWTSPVRHVLACTVAGRYVQQVEVPSMTEILGANQSVSPNSVRAMLLLSLVLAEDTGALIAAGRSQHVNIRMSHNTKDVWQLIHFVTYSILKSTNCVSPEQLALYKLELHCGTEQAVDLARLAISTIPQWVSDLKTKSSTVGADGLPTVEHYFLESLNTVMKLYDQDFVSDTIIQTFTSLEQTCHRLLRSALPRYVEHIAHSTQVVSWIEDLLAGDFEPNAVAYVDFIESVMSQLDVTSPDYLQDSQYVTVLQQAQRLLRCDGTAGIDDPVFQIVLEILTTVVEGFGDWPGPSPLDDAVRALAVESCSACLSKSRMPMEEMSAISQTWDSDDRARFQDVRLDIQDFMQNAYAILGIDLVQEIIQGVVSSDVSVEWNVLEAHLFCLLAFSDTIASEPEKFDKYIQLIFVCMKWVSALRDPANVPERVRQTMIKFIAENTGFLQRHTQSLLSSLSFLFTSLHIAASATAASRAIFTLCDAQRVMLVDTLPDFMSSLSMISDLEPDARNRIFGGVSAIIQALPTEEAKLQPLSQIISMIERATNDLLQSELDQAELLAKSAEMIGTLAAIGRGLRAPSDAPEDEDSVGTRDSTFWMTGGGMAIQSSVLQIYEALREKSMDFNDSVFVEAICDLLRSAFTEQHPSPFKFHSTIVVAILCHYITPSSSQQDLVMGTASSYLASANTSDPENGFLDLISQTTRVCRDVISVAHNQTNINTDFCAAILAFFTRLLPKWGKAWLVTDGIEESSQVILETALLLIEESDTLTRRAAASLFTALLEASGNTKITSEEQAASNMSLILRNYSPRMVAILVKLVGGECARSELDTLAEPIKKFVLKQPMIANRLVKEAVKAENGILTSKALEATTVDRRARFAAQVEGLRGARRTNEIVREFWIACRGTSFGYVV